MLQTNRQHFRCSARQRGTAYILVLGITAMFVVIGIGGTLLGRIALQQSELEDDIAAAGLIAEAALDVMHKRIDGSTTWRSLVANNTWSGPETIGTAQVQFKFVDEIDANLSGNTNQPFRLYAKATVGRAVRVYSVEFCPDSSGGYRRNGRTFRRDAAN